MGKLKMGYTQRTYRRMRRPYKNMPLHEGVREFFRYWYFGQKPCPVILINVLSAA